MCSHCAYKYAVQREGWGEGDVISTFVKTVKMLTMAWNIHQCGVDQNKMKRNSWSGLSLKAQWPVFRFWVYSGRTTIYNCYWYDCWFFFFVVLSPPPCEFNEIDEVVYALIITMDQCYMCYIGIHNAHTRTHLVMRSNYQYYDGRHQIDRHTHHFHYHPRLKANKCAWVFTEFFHFLSTSLSFPVYVCVCVRARIKYFGGIRVNYFAFYERAITLDFKGAAKISIFEI